MSLNDFERLSRTLADVFPGPLPTSREVRLVFAVNRVLAREPLEHIAGELKLQRRTIQALVDRVEAEGLSGLLAYEHLITEPSLAKRRQGIAQMLLGLLAERRFEDLSNQITGAGVLRIEDHRPSRTDTDYRLLNGNDNPICRFNVKFHGSLFREAQRYVGLDPADCFALAAYKINNALRRQEAEKLPYIFLVLSVPDLTAADAGRLVPDDYVWTLSVLQGRRTVEEGMVARLLTGYYVDRFQPILDRMPEGQFRVISAKKADKILRGKLFERVHALSLKGFTRKFRNAEVDMHFSLSEELTPVRTFLEILVRESPQKFAVRLYIGDY